MGKPNDALVGTDDEVRKIVNMALTVIRANQGTANEQASEQLLIAYVVGKQQQIRRAAAEIERLGKDRDEWKRLTTEEATKHGVTQERAEQAEARAEELPNDLEWHSLIATKNKAGRERDELRLECSDHLKHMGRLRELLDRALDGASE